MRINDEIIKEIKQRYYRNETVSEIAMYTGVSETSVSKLIRNKTNKGEWERHSAEEPKSIRRNADGTVICDAFANRHCIYGTSGGEKMCNYYAYFGINHRRGCPADHCNKFEQGTPKDKQRRGQFEFNEGYYGRATDDWKRHYKADRETY